MDNTANRTVRSLLPEAGPVSPVTTFSVFHFERGSRWWAFRQMGLTRALLKQVPGLRFHKMLGSGRGRVFSLWPDWNRYALLAVWDDLGTARQFLESSEFMRRFGQRAVRQSTLLLQTLQAHGKWSGVNPFLPAASSPPGRPEIAVLTRATIRPGRLLSFWRQAPVTSYRLGRAEGLRGSIGIGEAPFVTQATFSIWDSLAQMKEFAYGSNEHLATIRRTRHEHWYKEDLFARFIILESQGRFP